MPPIRGHPRHLHKQTTIDRPIGHNGRNGHRDSGAPIWRRRARGDRLGETAILAPDILGVNQRVAPDCVRLFRVARKWATPLCRITGSDERRTDSTEQAARGQAGQGGENLAPTNGEVCLAGDGGQRKVRMWDGTVSERGGSGHRKRDTCYAPPMGTDLPGGGLGVSPH